MGDINGRLNDSIFSFLYTLQSVLFQWFTKQEIKKTSLLFMPGVKIMTSTIIQKLRVQDIRNFRHRDISYKIKQRDNPWETSAFLVYYLFYNSLNWVVSICSGQIIFFNQFFFFFFTWCTRLHHWAITHDSSNHWLCCCDWHPWEPTEAAYS